jgi:catechol 2,3-dioxygenase-like lactoylglutathione lyase family enzyme
MTMLGNSTAAATIAVRNAEAARAFYGDTLGLKISQDLGPDSFLCEAGDSMILIYQRPNHEPSAATIVSFQVGDLGKEVAELQSKGVNFEDYDMPGLKTENGIATMPSGVKAAWFTDPDGNIISLGQM